MLFDDKDTKLLWDLDLRLSAYLSDKEDESVQGTLTFLREETIVFLTVLRNIGNYSLLEGIDDLSMSHALIKSVN